MPIRVGWTSLAWGAGIAAVFIVIVTGGDWIINLQGRFHGAAGTHWDMVMHTALAMALPAFLYASVGAWLVQLFRAGIKRLWGRKGW